LAVLLCTQYKPTCLHANEQYGQPKNTGDVAHNSRNYEQSYCYYSQILEEQIANGNAWLRKRVAAASLMASERDTVIKKNLIEKAVALGVTDQDRLDAASGLSVAYASITRGLNDELPR